MVNRILTNVELIESVIVDLNSLLKEWSNGQYIQSCTIVSQMTQKLVNLRNTVNNDLKNRDQTIEELKAQIRRLGTEVVDVAPEQVGEVVDEINQQMKNTLGKPVDPGA